jgi:prepilin-type N-terminal cleavage/methylation domain-containing protein
VNGHLRHRAFTLWELLLVVALLGVAGLLTAHLFRASMHAIDSSPRVQEQQAKLDRMLSSIRQDVWGAERIEASGKTILLSANGRQIEWTLDERSASRSAKGAAAEQWPLPFAIQAHQDGASLLLQSVGDATETRRFTSQVLLAAEAK